MRILKRLLPFLIATQLLPLYCFVGHVAGADTILGMQPEARASVTFIDGAPVLVGMASGSQPAILGQVLYAGDSVRTDSVSRVELTFVGGGIIRLAEETTLELGDGNADAGTPEDPFQVMLLEGQLWANFTDRPDTIQILAAGTTIAGVGSVFRAVVFDSGAMEIKDYSGKVTASGPFEIKKENGRYELGTVKRVEDDTPEPWRHQISPYRKIIIQVTGEATQPFRFAAKSDLTDWVRWNQERDEAVR